MESIHKKVGYSCRICGQDFTLKENMKGHIRRVHEKLEKFECKLCTKTFTAKQYFDKHVKAIHLDYYNYKCEYCDKTFNKIGNKKIHMDSVHAPTKSECKLCAKIFKSENSLAQHLKRHENNNSECPHCKKSILKSNMKAHINTVHLGIKRFKCTHCPVKMADSGAMKRHVKYKHETEKNFSCQ